MIPYVDLVALDPSTDAHHARVMGRAWPRLWGWCATFHEDILDGSTFERGAVPVDPVRIGADDCRRLADALDADLASGFVDEGIRVMLDDYSSRDLVDCSTCEGTGIRTDEVGRLMKLDEMELDESTALVVGRSTGTCDVCSGFGRHAHPETALTFERSTVEGFAQFLRHCGGLVIL